MSWKGFFAVGSSKVPFPKEPLFELPEAPGFPDERAFPDGRFGCRFVEPRLPNEPRFPDGGRTERGFADRGPGVVLSSLEPGVSGVAARGQMPPLRENELPDDGAVDRKDGFVVGRF